MKHASGSWDVVPDYDKPNVYRLWNAHGNYCEPLDEDTFTANARLMSAAPTLLKACKQALYALKGREHDQFLRDAIKEATGE